MSQLDKKVSQTARVASQLALALLVSCGAAACTSARSATPEAHTPAASEDDTLFGRSARIVYPQFTAEVRYVSPTELHWRTTAPDGTVAEGHEKPFYRRLSAHQHFLSWIEQDGFTVSQVIDTERLVVVAFGSYSDESSSRGHRTGSLLEGTFSFVSTR